jgi:hypothetical protein
VLTADKLQLSGVEVESDRHSKLLTGYIVFDDDTRDFPNLDAAEGDRRADVEAT